MSRLATCVLAIVTSLAVPAAADNQLALPAPLSVTEAMRIARAHRLEVVAARARARAAGERPAIRRTLIAKRIRPKMMTVMAILMGLLPIMWSHGAGADVMKRIATPMVGGVITSFVLELLIYPVIFTVWKGWRLSHHEGKPPTAIAHIANAYIPAQ
jgi:Cu(I)/Ag(I) efflux system membrane protein CusA/SilA